MLLTIVLLTTYRVSGERGYHLGRAAFQQQQRMRGPRVLPAGQEEEMRLLVLVDIWHVRPSVGAW